MSVNVVNKSTGALTKVAGNAITEASGINYSHTTSGMSATNVQDAIDESYGELKSGLTTLDDEVNGDATTYDFADVVTIKDAVPANLADCSVKIEPVQDLHGYDKPWVGGAYKNKAKPKNYSSDSYDGTTFNSPLEGAKVIDNVVLPAGTYVASIKMLSVPSTQRTLTFYKTGDVELAYFVNLNEKTVGQVYTTTFTLSEESTVYAKSWATGGGEWKMQMQLEAGDQATTFAPYTNICPITGHTEASVQRDGVNIFLGNNTSNPQYAGDYYVNSSKYNYVKSANAEHNCFQVEVFSSDTYRFVRETELSNIGHIRFLDKNKEFIRGTEINASATYGTFETPSNCKYIEFAIPKTSQYSISINYPSTDETFYNEGHRKTYTIALGSTIYGGTVDFNTGVCTVTHKVVDLGNYTWQKNNSNFYTTEITDFAKDTTGSLQYATYCISDKYKVRGQGGTIQIQLYYNTAYSGYRCFVFDDPAVVDMNTTQFKTYITGTHICYELATPTTIQLTPQQIQLLQGQNTLTASTGQISVTVNGVSGAIGAVQEQVNDHEERIEAVESGLTDVTTERLGGITFYKVGRLVMLVKGDGTVSTNADGEILDGADPLVIPSAYRPISTVNFSESYQNKRITISPATGLLTMPNDKSAANLTIRASAMWIA